MKKKILFSISSFLLLATIVFIGCKKNDSAVPVGLTRVPVPLITKDPTGDVNISGQNPASFVGKFVVDMYFKSDKLPQKVDVVVVKNGDNSNVKVLQAGITTFPTSLQVTGPQLVTLFGPIVIGDNFQVGADVTTADGVKVEAFPVTGTSYAAGIFSEPGASPIITYLAACTFSNTSFNGNYTVAQDDWADFSVGDPIAVAPGASSNQISVTAYPAPAFGNNRKPMIITVDPSTFAVTIPLQVIGDYFGAPPNATIKGTGTVNPCGDNISLTVTINVGGTDYPGLVLKLNR
jgi:hypothetical protein